jgi:hypothetical protein
MTGEREAPPEDRWAALSDDPRVVLAGGAVFLVSGLSLVLHILTGAPLWALLAALVVAAGVVASRLLTADPGTRRRWVALVRAGVLIGLVSTAAYDSSRWLLVRYAGMRSSPFTALPFFGDALLGGLGSSGVRRAAGIAFHLTNGVAFGTAYLVWFGHRSWRWGVPFALVLEAFMLALYPGWLDARSVRELTEISLVGHVAYGLSLGLLASTARARLPRPGLPSADLPPTEP